MIERDESAVPLTKGGLTNDTPRHRPTQGGDVLDTENDYTNADARGTVGDPGNNPNAQPQPDSAPLAEDAPLPYDTEPPSR